MNREPKAHASGVNALDLAEHMGFSLGTALVGVWQHTPEGLEIAKFHVNRALGDVKATAVRGTMPHGMPMMAAMQQQANAAPCGCGVKHGPALRQMLARVLAKEDDARRALVITLLVEAAIGGSMHTIEAAEQTLGQMIGGG